MMNDKDVFTELGDLSHKGSTRGILAIFSGITSVGVILIITAMAAGGRGTNHPWVEYDQELNVNANVGPTNQVDYYFEDMNKTYRETVWATFGIVLFLAVSCIVMAASGALTGFHHEENWHIFSRTQMVTMLMSAFSLLLVVQPLHNSYDSDSDATAGVHFEEYAAKNNLGTTPLLTVKHKDGWVVTVFVTGLVCILAAPFIAQFCHFFVLKVAFKFVENSPKVAESMASYAMGRTRALFSAAERTILGKGKSSQA